MSSHKLDEEAIFGIASGIPDPETRQGYLDQVCAGDQALRERVEALLQVHEQEQEFLKSNPEVAPTVDQPAPTEAVGQQIGRYKLLQQIGEGGFGVVYMAEQHRPVRRKVALKVIKPGMDTGAVVARFEAERQALAMMDHPNISRVLDGGATENGRPYFVMELVRGVAITEYCDKNQLPTKARLELFMTVCQAVQHAHQKGVIHRDIKPSNILVTLHDGQPVVKVIDFGVAKAINQQLTEKTLFTAYGQMVGTPQYMSPEQAEMSGLDVDTRSDIYSLGVLLYELLTGETPLDAERLRTAGYAEMQRIIQEEEPAKPSMRLSTLDEKLSIVSELRGTDESHLRQYVKGDLDWIVMTAIDKDRGRRYGTASSFAADVDRFLQDQPIEARPPSQSYRLRKFARRNKGPVAAALAISLALIGGIIGTTWGMLAAKRNAALASTNAALATGNATRAEQEQLKTQQANKQLENALEAVEQKNLELVEAQQEIEQQNTQLIEQKREITYYLLDQALVHAMSGNEPRTKDLISNLQRLEAPEAEVEMVKGVLVFYTAVSPMKALEHFRLATELNPQSVAVWGLIQKLDSITQTEYGREARAKLKQLSPTTHLDYLFLGRATLSIPLLEKSIELRDSALGRLYLAEAQSWHAIRSKNWGEMTRALANIQTARGLMGNTFHVAITQIAVFDQAVCLARQQGKGAEIERLIAAASEAAAIVEADLAQRPGQPLGLYFPAIHFDWVQEDVAKAKSYWERAAIREDGTIVDFMFQLYVAFVLRRYGLDHAVHLYDRYDTTESSSSTRAYNAFLLALTPDRREEAQRIWEETQMLDARLIVPILLGNAEAARNARVRGGRWDNLNDYLLGEIDESEYLTREGESGRASAQFYMGLNEFAPGGDREKARKHFQLAAKASIYGMAYNDWATAFLAQMDRDPSWPPYLAEEED